MSSLRILLGGLVLASSVVAATVSNADAAEHGLLSPAATVETLGSAFDGASGPASVTFIGATVNRAQTAIVLRFWAADASPCVGTGDRQFAATVALTRAAATVTITEHYAGPPAILPAGAQCMRTLNAKAFQVDLALAAPLGARPLITAGGQSIPVTRG